MAWYECITQGNGGHIEPPEWDIEMDDVVLDEPIELGVGNYEFGFFVDTNESAYNRDNALGFVSWSDDWSEHPELRRFGIEFSINMYEIRVFIRGHVCFSDSADREQALGEQTGAVREFVGDYRNKNLRISIGGDGSASFSCTDEGVPSFFCSVRGVGIPVEWEEGHEGEWQYITRYDFPDAASENQIGGWYGGAGRYTFNGTITHLRIKQVED